MDALPHWGISVTMVKNPDLLVFHHRRAHQQAFAVHDLNHVIDTFRPEKLERANQFLP